MLAVLGATEEAVAILGSLPSTMAVTRTVWELKILINPCNIREK